MTSVITVAVLGNNLRLRLILQKRITLFTTATNCSLEYYITHYYIHPYIIKRNIYEYTCVCQMWFNDNVIENALFV